MFSLHYFTFLIILFFLFYNAIGKNKTITHKWFIKAQRCIDVRIARWLLRIKRLNFNEINEASYKKLQYKPLLLVGIGFILGLFFPENKITLFVFQLSIIILPLIIIGLISSKRLVQTVKENLKATLFYGLMIVAVIILLLLSGEKGSLKSIIIELSKFVNEFYNFVETTGLNLSSFSPWMFLFVFLFIIVFINLLVWIALRIITKLLLWLFVGFGKLCHSLNNNSPLKPFYLLFQVGSVIFSEVILKIFSS